MQNKRPVIACFGAVLGACGFLLFGPTPGGGNQEAAVEQTVDSYVRAFAAGDGKAACEALTDSAREAVVGMAGRIGATDCASAMEKTRELGGRQVRSIAGKIRVGEIDVNGGAARVTLHVAGQDAIAELERTSDGWKISSLPRA